MVEAIGLYRTRLALLVSAAFTVILLMIFTRRVQSPWLSDSSREHQIGSAPNGISWTVRELREDIDSPSPDELNERGSGNDGDEQNLAGLNADDSDTDTRAGEPPSGRPLAGWWRLSGGSKRPKPYAGFLRALSSDDHARPEGFEARKAAPRLGTGGLRSIGGAVEGGVMSLFEDFIAEHRKEYESQEEKERRLQIFAENLVLIASHNASKTGYSLGVNRFTDLTWDEFRAFHGHRGFLTPRLMSQQAIGPLGPLGPLGPIIQPRRYASFLLNVDEKALPTQVDWNARGCVSTPRHQRRCGACYAFSAAGAVEGAHCLRTGKLVEFSPQQVVDCSFPERNLGCNGGMMADAFTYVMHRGGLCKYSDYPYTAHLGRCYDRVCSPEVAISDFHIVPPRSVKALKAAIATRGPVAVAIESDVPALQFYKSGVFTAPCGDDLDHGVLAVGYGKDEASGREYWLVKNSWGVEWGEKGFVKLAMQTETDSGQCGVMLYPSYPILK